jgi:hypothetical protein
MHTVVPLQRSAARWLKRPGRIWLSWSIFNPNGPTVSCLGLRDTGRPDQAEVFYRWMHFLGGEDYALGQVDLGADDSNDQLAAILAQAFALQPGQGLRRFAMVTCIPSVVVSNVAEEWLPILRGGLERSAAIQEADWGRERYLLAKYGNRLFDRAGEELREAYERMRAQQPSEEQAKGLDAMYATYAQVPTFAQWTSGNYASRAMQAGDFDAWWDEITAVNFWPPAAAQLAHAWDNAIKQTTLAHRTPLAEVRDFFAAYGMPIFNESAARTN